ncbi:apolipoprotein D and lipocalin family protein [Xylophilus ampelinus]|uniref:Outer membrane lipoprotein Blc n=2 Tax=Xylophilus ampelinus TaxID=54067 RepID=A0A318SKB9_9BURK|nr:apolipoprotein D and lipocalin family protein [Xylophilus ampelinus]
MVASFFGGLAYAAEDAPALSAVASVDLLRYAGTWYEIARIPNFFQRKCVSDVSANYAPQTDGTVTVTNRCRRADGEVEAVVGQARRPSVRGEPIPDEGKLRVRFAPRWLAFIPAVWGDYWILSLDPQYTMSLVGTPDRHYLWLLSRYPTVGPDVVDEWLARAQALGFDITHVVRAAAPTDTPD